VDNNILLSFNPSLVSFSCKLWPLRAKVRLKPVFREEPLICCFEDNEEDEDENGILDGIVREIVTAMGTSHERLSLSKSI
jgi:hypothetical protein